MPTTSPLADKVVTIFGGSGFVGRHVAEDLLQQNARVRIAARTPEDAFSLKPLAKLGTRSLCSVHARPELATFRRPSCLRPPKHSPAKHA